MNIMTTAGLNPMTTGPIVRTKLPGPNARRLITPTSRLISPSYTRSYPLVAKSGRGIVIEDVDGNEFFDFSAGIAVVAPDTAIPRWLPPYRSRRRSCCICLAQTFITRS